MVEAGHRCAIPTCRTVSPLQIEHIVDWARVQKHEFDNMIVLCANCHGRKGTRRGQIDRKSLLQYKANLTVLNSRYGEIERRVLDHFAERRPVWRSVSQTIDRSVESLKAANKILAQISELRRDIAEECQDSNNPFLDEALTGLLKLESASEERINLTERLVDAGARFKDVESGILEVARGTGFMFLHLSIDGLIERVDNHPGEVVVNGQPIVEIYRLTEAGRAFVDRWQTAQPLDG
ncbi:hypothetical protein Ahu01nite_018880 [Winogradskya humida]|uniref:HNH domain-containing protein n=2 Tax=Winogradskya humida TaxID=113566 RepID=A0ABQ3ZJL7_9ACTN|nr:hypothetical protein Ahu01nite_018880 [Actinoplanes humidus]